jgi:hypothetical protein
MKQVTIIIPAYDKEKLIPGSINFYKMHGPNANNLTLKTSLICL